MLFRPPMRLEKWIAYDAALGADLVVLTADAVNDAAESPDPGILSGLDILPEPGDPSADMDGLVNITIDGEDGLNVRGDDAAISVTIKDEVLVVNELFPYLEHDDDGDATDDFFSSFVEDGGTVQAGDVYFEISKPDGGTFGFVDWQDIRHLDAWQTAGFADAWGIRDGDRLMFIVASYKNEAGDVTAFVLQEFEYSQRRGPGDQGSFELADGQDQGHSHSGDVGTVEGRYAEDGALLLHLIENGRESRDGNSVLDSTFRSLTFTTDGAPRPEVITGFEITMYHKDGWRDDSIREIRNDIEDAENSGHDDGITFASSRRSDGDNSGGGGEPGDGGEEGGGTDPDPDPDPPDNGNGDEPGNQNDDDLINHNPSDSGGGESGDGTGDESGDEPGDGAGDDSGSESGSGPGDGDGSGGESGAGGDEPGYIFQNDEDGSFSDSGDADSEAEARENAAPVAEARQDAPGTPETAAEAEQLELTRDMEFLLTAVRNEKEVLLSLIGRLQGEYLARDPADYGELRGYLRRLFDMGRHEEETVNRIIDSMNREMSVFRAAEPVQRDGMLSESVRELIDSAERHSGEMGAYSQAVEAVADLLAARRAEGLPPPTDVEASALFAAKYEQALSAWQADAERIDPMGREFTAAQRVAGA